MDSPILTVNGLCRSFGSIKAVDNISFQLEQGHVVGLIGANGAGKTTTMRMLATLDFPDAGQILIHGVDAVNYPERVRSRIGWMPDSVTPYPNTSVLDYLDFFARAYKLSAAQMETTLNDVIAFTEIEELLDRPIDKLSKGQIQRLCLARTLVSDPDLLILDEPAAGLDPKARIEFKNLVFLLKKKGKTLLISSHILSELGEMCDKLIFMDAGRLIHEGDKELILSTPIQGESSVGWPFEIDIAQSDPSALVSWLELRPGWQIREQRQHGVLATFSSNAPEKIAAELRSMCQELPICSFHPSERRLEEAFIDLLKHQESQSTTSPQTPQIFPFSPVDPKS